MRGLLFPYLFARVFSGPSFEDVALQFHASFVYFSTAFWNRKSLAFFMKIKSILATIVLITCGSLSAQNLDKYKNKFLDVFASQAGTTREFLVEDLKIEVTDMTLSHFLVEDSIAFLTQKYEQDIEERKKRIESYEEAIKESSSNNTNGKHELIRGALEMAKRHSVNEFQGAIKETKSEIEDLTKTYNAALEYYKDKDTKRVLYDVVYFRMIMVPPQTGIRKVIEGFGFFTPGGEKMYEDYTSDLIMYMEQKNKK